MLARLSLGLLAALAFAAPAHAAAPMAGKTYEGPGPKGGEAVSLVVSSSGKRVTRISMGFERGCSVRGKRMRQTMSVLVRNRPIRNGRIAWSRSIDYPQTGGWLRTRMKGKFVSGGRRFVGTIRERVVNPQNGVRCDSGNVRFSAAVPERELVNGDWGGTTAQGHPIALTIGRQGVTALRFDVALECTNGERIVRSFELPRAAHLSEDLTFTAGSYAGEAEIKAEGTASRRAVTGAITAEEWIERPRGVDDSDFFECTSGAVPYEARR